MRINAFSNLVTLLSLVLLTGCATSDSGFGNRTAVVINNRTPKEIMEKTLDIFRAKEFDVKTAGKMESVFERKGSSWQDVKWGSWYGGGVWERANVRIISYGAGAYMVEAKTEWIRDKSEEFYEDTQRMTRRERKPYQELLNELKAQLDGPPA